VRTRVFQGKKLSAARLRAGMTQADLAYDLRGRGVKATPQGIVRWEKGHHMPRAAVIPALADVLGCSMEELYGDDDDEEDAVASVMTRAANALASHGESDLAAALRREAAAIAQQQGVAP
jgi:transcriptional regulator with XRE-family HTH domain